MAVHPSILAWRIPWTEEPGGPQSLKGSDTSEATQHTKEGSQSRKSQYAKKDNGLTNESGVLKTDILSLKC